MATAFVTTVNPVAAATYFVEKLGCTAFPVWGSTAGRCACGDPHNGTAKWGPDNVGKHPATVHGFKDATADVSAIRTFLANPGTPNYGLNAPEGVLAIDVDGADGEARWRELERLYGALPVTLTTITANGRHYFFRWPADAGPMPRGKLFGFVVRRHDDGYVIGPGSVHPTGIVYDTLRQANGKPYNIEELPASWVAATVRPVLTVVTGPAPLPTVGQRHDWLRDRARHYRGMIEDPAVLRATLLAENARLAAPKSEAEVDRAIGDVYAKFPLDPPEEVEARIDRKLGEDELALLSPITGDFPMQPAMAAFDGLLGDLVDDLSDGTDASLVGLLGSLIAFCGALVPGQAYFHRLQTSSPFIALIGESGVGRKGTAMMRVHGALMSAIEPTYVNRVVADGLASGEALVSFLSIRRESFPHEPTVALVYGEEYAQILTARQRDGSTLDPKMREAFDGGPLSNRRSSAADTKSVPGGYWVPALVAITPSELRTRQEAGALQSGSANRWLYLPVHMRNNLPTNAEPEFSLPHRAALVAARRKALDTWQGRVSVAPVVTRTLAEYDEFLRQVTVSVGRDLTRRYSAIAFRIALIHTLVDRAPVVDRDRIDRGLALTEYARRGIPWVFGDAIGTPDADLLYRHLMDRGRLSKTAIVREIIRDPIRRQAAIDELIRLKVAAVAKVHGDGRPKSELIPLKSKPSTTFDDHLRGIGKSDLNRETVELMEQRSAQDFTPSANTVSPENGEIGGVLELSPDPRTNQPKRLGKNLEKRWKELELTGAKSESIRRPDGTVWCHFYIDHQSRQRDVSGADPWCEVCTPKEEGPG